MTTQASENVKIKKPRRRAGAFCFVRRSATARKEPPRLAVAMVPLMLLVHRLRREEQRAAGPRLLCRQLTAIACVGGERRQHDAAGTADDKPRSRAAVMSRVEDSRRAIDSRVAAGDSRYEHRRSDRRRDQCTIFHWSSSLIKARSGRARHRLCGRHIFCLMSTE